MNVKTNDETNEGTSAETGITTVGETHVGSNVGAGVLKPWVVTSVIFMLVLFVEDTKSGLQCRIGRTVQI